MDDEYDIYGDLEGFEAKAAQDNKVVQELKAQIAELRSQIAAKEHEKQETIARNTVLLENISSLLVTAKAELKRKDAVIADIRRDRDNAAFRRTKPVHTHDRGTQTRLIKLLSTGVQTTTTTTTEGEGHHGHRVKKEKEVDWHWERNRVEEDHRRDRDRFREKERVPVRERLGNRGMVRQEMNQVRVGRRGRNRTHEEERERDRQARHGPRSPDAERMRSAVRFRSPVRVKTDDSSVPDSASDIELSRAFIPMNRKELDRYVKEIGRDQNRSPVIAEVTKPDKNSKLPNEVPPSDPWDARPRKKIKTPKKHRKRTSKTPVKQKSPKIIQSDEIGTTACGSSSLSPVKSEDIEQRMSALHGHPPLPEPPELTIPPPEPPIIEHVPELPLEDDAKLNDSRELKIIESSDEQQQQQQQPAVVEDEPNTSAETVIERSTSVMEDGENGDLEDGEIITPAPSPAEPPSKEEIAEARRNATIAKAVAQLAQETEAKSNQEQPVVPQSNHHTKEKPSKPKRKRVEPPAEEIPPAKQQEPTPPAEQEDNRTNAKHKRNLNGAFELPNVPESHEQQQRRNTFSGAIANEKVKRKQRLSEPTSEKGHKKKSETLQELFGSEDDDSFVVAPTLPPPPPKDESNRIEEVGGGKRKRTESVGEGLDSKKRKSEGVEICEERVKGDQLIELKKSDEVLEKEDGGDVPRKEENTVVQSDAVAAENEIESVSSKEELETKNDSTSGSENTEENIISQDESGPKEDGSVDSDGNKDSLESESVPDVANESISGSEPATNGGDVPENKIDPVANDDEVASEKIDEPQVMEVIQEVEIKPSEGPPTHHHEVIVVSNKYCEYRIEEDNEAETTFYVTRKKKKKNKSKSRNASQNASGAN